MEMGWRYFYQVLLAFFDDLKFYILKGEHFDILCLVKGNTSGGKRIYKDLKHRVDWKSILETKSLKFDISRAFLSKMLNKDTNSVIISERKK